MGNGIVILDKTFYEEKIYLFISSDASCCSAMALPPLGNSDHVVSVSIDSPSNSQQDAPFHRIAYDYSCADWDTLCDHLRDTLWEDIFKLSASASASEFCEWVQVGIDVYIPCRKYQVKPHSSPWFSVAWLMRLLAYCQQCSQQR